MTFRGIGKDEALRLAREAAERQGIKWIEPVRVSRLFGKYYVSSNLRARGGTVHVTVSARDGNIISVKETPR